MNEFTQDDMNMACDLMLGFCILVAIFILGVCTALFVLIGQPALDQVTALVLMVIHYIGGCFV